MEAVVFDGKEYIKASVLAARFRYTADYLGQLCRGKKVDARLVGRAWYINLDSLNQHRTGRYKSSAPAKEKEVPETPPKKPSNNYLSRIDVEPILRKKTVSIVKSTKGSLTELPVKYERDDYSLIPRFNSQAVSKEIRINQADAEKLDIAKEQSPVTAFKAESLPEVYLKGAVKVAGLAEAVEEEIEETGKIEIGEVSNIEPKTKLERMAEPARPKQVMIRQIKRPVALVPPRLIRPTPINQVKIAITAPKTTAPTTPVVQKPLIRPRVLVKKPQLQTQHQSLPQTPPVAPKITAKAVRIDVVRAKVDQPNFKPQAVAHSEAKKLKKQETSSGWSFIFFALVIALVTAVWILGARAEISVDGGRHVENWKFDIDQLRERF